MATIISERGVNIHFFPIINSRGKNFEGTYIRKNKVGIIEFEAEEGSRWTLGCYNLMDFFATKIRKRFDEECHKRFDKTLKPEDAELRILCPLLENPNDIYDFEKYLNGDQNYNIVEKSLTWYRIQIGISVNEILKQSYIKSNQTHIKNIVDYASKCKVKISYKFRSKSNDSKYRYHTDFTSTNFYNLFNYKLKDNFYLFEFNTMLSVLFLHNLFTGGYEVVDPVVYSLSPSANILYRKRFLPYRNLKQVTLDVDTVSYYLGLSQKNKTDTRKVFVRTIEELIDSGLINLIRKTSDRKFELTTCSPSRTVVPFKTKEI